MERLLEKEQIPPRIILRVIFLTAASMVFLIYRFFYKAEDTLCLRDVWHNFTQPLNSALDRDNNDNILIGIGQVIMDFWIVSTCIFWYGLAHTGL